MASTRKGSLRRTREYVWRVLDALAANALGLAGLTYPVHAVYCPNDHHNPKGHPMGPLSNTDQDALKQAARLTGEAGTVFYDTDLAGIDAHWLRTHTLPALLRRGFVQPKYVFRTPTKRAYVVTDKGFDHAMQLTGGLGLL